MNILDQIISDKKKEVEERKKRIPLKILETNLAFSREAVSLRSALMQPGATGIIAEFKRRSPSKGWINRHAEVLDVVKNYQRLGATGLSILTDEKYFGGTEDDILNARPSVNIPILRKEFIIDEYQVTESKILGADVILLIAACLSPQQVASLATKARQLGMEVLLEIHNQKELGHICDEVDLVGVNNRNLSSFEVDIQTSFQLVGKIPVTKPAISESGISGVESIVSLKKAGFTGFLIGENFMKYEYPAIAFAEFVKQLRAKE